METVMRLAEALAPAVGIGAAIGIMLAAEKGGLTMARIVVVFWIAAFVWSIYHFGLGDQPWWSFHTTGPALGFVLGNLGATFFGACVGLLAHAIVTNGERERDRLHAKRYE